MLTCTYSFIILRYNKYEFNKLTLHRNVRVYSRFPYTSRSQPRNHPSRTCLLLGLDPCQDIVPSGPVYFEDGTLCRTYFDTGNARITVQQFSHGNPVEITWCETLQVHSFKKRQGTEHRAETHKLDLGTNSLLRGPFATNVNRMYLTSNKVFQDPRKHWSRISID